MTFGLTVRDADVAAVTVVETKNGISVPCSDRLAMASARGHKCITVSLLLLHRVGLVQKQTREVEEAETLLVRGIRELSEMEQIDQNVPGEARAEQKRGGLGQLMAP